MEGRENQHAKTRELVATGASKRGLRKTDGKSIESERRQTEKKSKAKKRKGKKKKKKRRPGLDVLCCERASDPVSSAAAL